MEYLFEDVSLSFWTGKVGKVETVIKEMNMYDMPADLLECDEGYQIAVSGWWAAVPELGISLHEGVFCRYDETKQAYLPDFSVTVIRSSEEKIEEGEWIWYGQDGFVLTLAAYLHEQMDIEQIEQLTCVICIPNTD